ncbi:DUF6355 family natural product biosynthesis protein [Allokutzneria albata]|uniref:Secreted protein n=1 Tax=Allokutzneria albata TaxID=211114 RepID=A0A1G9R939_ALLAB|nr:DUF6355 family natural product biosynthesis protein [Allokutzneria albata]SDM19799.1 hypothetical protein SAMN04489726_0309 [Allokutzneria albata]
MNIRAAAVAALSLAAMSLAVPSANAAPGCGGYWNDATYAYYTHCGPTSVLIDVDVAWGADFTRCVGPNSTTNIGLWPRTRNAWYVRPC